MIPLNNLPGPGGHVGGLLAPEHASTAGARVPQTHPAPEQWQSTGVGPRPRGRDPQGAPMPVEPALTTADAVRSALAGLSDGPRAERTARYLRAVPGGYGEGDRFRGATVPQIRAVVARTALDDDELERLVAGPWHEEQMAALLIAVGRVKRLNRLLDRAQARPGPGTQTPPTVRDALAGREALGQRYLGWAARGAQAPRRRPTPGGLVHHSDHGSQYLSIAYTGRLVDEGTGRLGRSRGLLPAQAPPPNTATIETTPPRHPPQHNQPTTKPRTIL